MESHAQKRVAHEDFKIDERMLLLYNSKCTARCAHCAAESTTGAEQKMSVDEAKYYIKIAAAKGFKWILWTGGEVFIYYSEILELTRYGNSLGLLFSIDTNAFWANSLKEAIEKLLPLKEAGVTHIGISCDGYHIPYVPIEKIFHAVNAAREIELSAEVQFTYCGKTDLDNEILKKLREKNAPHSVADLARVGFAKRLPDEVFHLSEISELSDCVDLGPLVLPNGDVIGCCNPTVSEASPVFIGSGKEKFGKNLDSFLSSPLIRLIDKKGMKGISEILTDNPSFQAIGNKKYSHCCELCADIFKQPELYQELKEYLAQTSCI